jgi:DNA-directed RNA polymerase subunit RPC12/RpoP
MIEFKCAGCGAQLEIDDSQMGHTVVCPQCKSQNQAPGTNIPHMGVVCNNCGNEMHIESAFAGTMQRCPSCGAMVAVPELGKTSVLGGCMNVVALFVAIVTTGLLGLIFAIRG